MNTTTSKAMATLTALIGALAVFYALAAALGYELSQPLQDALTGVGGLVLIVAGIWFNPSVASLGPSEPKPPSS